ncbi:DUF421 domain-containing protein [Moraxella nasovis]|uniref:DUF421 domain-containing protein n=1 Tax=Moraxella nasovis TaxID=2904121 RepID=UPI001F61A511|nr:YetF domain-containing protein [Moraxella nasovis]UNU72512.1 DUF421 domain-containing protein [Moraxella nasovis]
MNLSQWLTVDINQLIGILLSLIGIYIGVIIYTRLLGLRSFTKLSGYDFAMTVAIGSILASTALSAEPSLLQGLFTMGALFGLQRILSWIRIHLKPVKRMVDNQPMILMAHGQYLWDNIHACNLSKSDIQGILRQNNIKSSSQVFAVIMETSGDVSVLKNDDTDFEPELFNDIREWELLKTLHPHKKH